MNYKQELILRESEIKLKLKVINREIKGRIKRNEDYLSLIDKRNLLTIDLKTVKSRLSNRFKDKYVINTKILTDVKI